MWPSTGGTTTIDAVGTVVETIVGAKRASDSIASQDDACGVKPGTRRDNS